MSSGGAVYITRTRSGKERKVDNKVPNFELSLDNGDRVLISLVSSYIPNKIASCWIGDDWRNTAARGYRNANLSEPVRVLALYHRYHSKVLKHRLCN